MCCSPRAGVRSIRKNAYAAITSIETPDANTIVFKLKHQRKKLINEIEKIVLGHVYYIPGIWWARSVVHWAKVKNYVAPPNHYSKYGGRQELPAQRSSGVVDQLFTGGLISAHRFEPFTDLAVGARDEVSPMPA